MIYKCYDYNLIVQYLLHGNAVFLCTQHEGCGHLFCKCHKFSQSLCALSTTTERNYIKNYYSPSSGTVGFNALRQLNCLFHNKSHQLFQTEESFFKQLPFMLDCMFTNY